MRILRALARRLRLALLAPVALVAVCGGAVLADQTDPRLAPLFDQLKVAAGPVEEQRIELEIWGIWGETPDPGVGALMRAGTTALNTGDYAAALAAFDQVVALAPDYAEGWNKRATVNYLLDNLDASLADIAMTLKLEPRHFGALAGRGLVYAKMHDLPRALAAFEEALAVSPQMTGPRVNAEAIRQALGQRGI